MAGARFLAGAWIFFFSTISRASLGLIQSPIQWITEALPLGGKAAGVWC